jgi:hypothetical protein
MRDQPRTDPLVFGTDLDTFDGGSGKRRSPLWPTRKSPEALCRVFPEENYDRLWDIFESLKR